MMKLLLAFAIFSLIATVTEAQQKMTPFRPNAGTKKEVIAEYKDFIIYGGDTLNRRDASGQKKGAWIEYVKIYAHRTNGVTDVVDSTLSSYAIKMVGRYKNGLKKGLWCSFDVGGKVIDTIKYD